MAFFQRFTEPGLQFCNEIFIACGEEFFLRAIQFLDTRLQAEGFFAGIEFERA